MNIELELDHAVSNQSLLVTVFLQDQHLQIDLANRNQRIRLQKTNEIKNQSVLFGLQCNDIKIIDYPVTVTNVILDDFYQSNKLIHSGLSVYDQQFLQHAQVHCLELEPAASDCNCLIFTGRLEYRVRWPFWQEMFL